MTTAELSTIPQLTVQKPGWGHILSVIARKEMTDAFRNRLFVVALMMLVGLTLIAISLGAVFLGAMTYIGNGPNLMIKAIAESQDVRMPSFFGYMAYSAAFMLPAAIVVTLVFLV